MIASGQAAGTELGSLPSAYAPCNPFRNGAGTRVGLERLGLHLSREGQCEVKKADF